MASKVWGKPEIPPKVELGDTVTRFDGWLQSNSSSPKGHYTFTIGVPASEKFKAMLMTEHPSMVLHFEVSLRPAKDRRMAIEGEMDEDVDDALRAALGLKDDRDTAQSGALDWSKLSDD